MSLTVLIGEDRDMGLIASTKKNNKADQDSKKVLAKYLERCSEISCRGDDTNTTHRDARKKIKKMTEHELSPYFYQKIKLQDIEKKQTEIKNAAKTYGMKAKINYASDSRSLQEILDTPAGKVAAAAAVPLYAGFLWGVQSVVGMANEKAAAIVTACMAGKLAVKVGLAYASRARSDSEKAKFDDYAELRHAQFALKHLKKEIVKRQKAENKNQHPTLSMLISKQAAAR